MLGPKSEKFNPYPPMVHYGYPVSTVTVKKLANEHRLHGYTYKFGRGRNAKRQRVWDLVETGMRVAQHINRKFKPERGWVEISPVMKVRLPNGREFRHVFSFATNYDIQRLPPPDAIAQIGEYLGFHWEPKWYLDSICSYWIRDLSDPDDSASIPLLLIHC